MTIEEVIAIAKTLRPGFYNATIDASGWHWLTYSTEYGNENFSEISWAAVLLDAGWKG